MEPVRYYKRAMNVSREDIFRALDQVIDPVSGRSVVQQNMITGLVVRAVSGGNAVGFALEVAPDRGRGPSPCGKPARRRSKR